MQQHPQHKEIDTVPVVQTPHPEDGRVYSNATPDHEKPIDKKTPHCVGCTGYHGGVGAMILCLEARVRALETENKTLKMR